MSQVILICTVGGSHEPILTSIRENKPNFVCFICSEKDPTTGKPGSVIQIDGPGRVIKKQPGDQKPTLPNIPTQAGLDATYYEVVQIPADDLEKAFMTIRRHLRTLTNGHPDASIIADYTGGTKSMTAALVLAAVEDETINLQLVTGVRTNLKAVEAGMEATVRTSVEAIRVQRDTERLTSAWQYFAYGEAARGLADIRPSQRDLADKVRVLKDLSKAFDAWDRFDHEQADNIIEPYNRQIVPAHKHLLDSIRMLTRQSKHQEPARLLDLWLNALRRAEQGRFDDAVARLYRLLEWTAQWILRVTCSIDTADITEDKIPSDMSLRRNRKGKYQAGLRDAWRLIGHHLPGRDIGQFSTQKLEALQNQINLRNDSILAHGYKPVGEREWEEFKQWIEINFLELLQKEAKKSGLHSIPKQLPQQPWHGLEI